MNLSILACLAGALCTLPLEHREEDKKEHRLMSRLVKMLANCRDGPVDYFSSTGHIQVAITRYFDILRENCIPSEKEKDLSAESALAAGGRAEGGPDTIVHTCKSNIKFQAESLVRRLRQVMNARILIILSINSIGTADGFRVVRVLDTPGVDSWHEYQHYPYQIEGVSGILYEFLRDFIYSESEIVGGFLFEAVYVATKSVFEKYKLGFERLIHEKPLSESGRDLLEETIHKCQTEIMAALHRAYALPMNDHSYLKRRDGIETLWVLRKFINFRARFRRCLGIYLEEGQIAGEKRLFLEDTVRILNRLAERSTNNDGSLLLIHSYLYLLSIIQKGRASLYESPHHNPLAAKEDNLEELKRYIREVNMGFPCIYAMFLAVKEVFEKIQLVYAGKGLLTRLLSVCLDNYESKCDKEVLRYHEAYRVVRNFIGKEQPADSVEVSVPVEV